MEYGSRVNIEPSPRGSDPVSVIARALTGAAFAVMLADGKRERSEENAWHESLSQAEAETSSAVVQAVAFLCRTQTKRLVDVVNNGTEDVEMLLARAARPISDLADPDRFRMLSVLWNVLFAVASASPRLGGRDDTVVYGNVSLKESRVMHKSLAVFAGQPLSMDGWLAADPIYNHAIAWTRENGR